MITKLFYCSKYTDHDETYCSKILFAVSKDNNTIEWRRNCKPRLGVDLGCRQHEAFHGFLTVDECLCTSDLCNKDMGIMPSETTTPSPVTTSSTTIGKRYILLDLEYV